MVWPSRQTSFHCIHKIHPKLSPWQQKNTHVVAVLTKTDLYEKGLPWQQFQNQYRGNSFFSFYSLFPFTPSSHLQSYRYLYSYSITPKLTHKTLWWIFFGSIHLVVLRNTCPSNITTYRYLVHNHTGRGVATPQRGNLTSSIHITLWRRGADIVFRSLVPRRSYNAEGWYQSIWMSVFWVWSFD